MKRFFLLSLIIHASFFMGNVFAQKYTNPVYDIDAPDPSIQRAQDGTFYSYATGCRTQKSMDLVHWTNVSDVFGRPTWNDTTYVKDGKQHTDYYSLWASDVNYVDGRYLMYYASALWGNGSRTGIGVATGLTPYKFTDRGRLFRSTEIKVENSIDPVYIEEWDKKYLAWGSFNGIYITELTDDGLKVRDTNKIKKIAGTAFEGAMIHKHGNHYYLFASIGACCEGLRSTYQMVVGRSTNLLGPYISKDGKLMTNNGYTLLLSKNSKWIGPGHNSEIVTDDEGQDWILYHAYDASDDSKGRVMLLDRLRWDSQGWPYVKGGTPSYTEQDAPIFYKEDGARMDYKIANSDFMKSQMKGWTTSKAEGTTLESGLGSAFLPLMHAADGSFSIEQGLSGLTDGYYEVLIQGFASHEGPQIRVNGVTTPMLDGSQLSNLPTTADAISRQMLNGDFLQSACGLAVNGKLTIGLFGDLAAGDKLWAGRVQLVRRHRNDSIGQVIQPWYVERAQEVINSPAVDTYYKDILQSLLASLQDATPDTRYSTLVRLHKQLDRLHALDPLYDGIEEVKNEEFRMKNGPNAVFDLSGRRVNNSQFSNSNYQSKKGVYVVDGKVYLGSPLR